MVKRRQRRLWDDVEKRRIVAQTRVAGVSVSQVARRYDVNANLASLASELTSRDFLIEKLKYQLAGVRRHQFESRAESLDQLELTLEEEEIALSAEGPKTSEAPVKMQAPGTGRNKTARLWAYARDERTLVG